MWQSGTGDPVQQSYYNISSEEREFNSTLITTLLVDDTTCTEAMGYVCVLSNGVLTESLNIHCNPGRFI